MHWLDYIIIATYVAQICQICFYAVPSAGSSREMLLNRKRKSISFKRHPGAAVIDSAPKIIVSTTATLAVLAASMIPLLTIVYPEINRYLLPFTDMPPPFGRTVISAGLLLSGNSLTYIGVETLRAHVRFHDFGEATCLYSAGIYRYVRNPITLGLVSIFTGFITARPSGAMLVGTTLFMLNAHYRIKMEEIYLENTFGDDYLQYKTNVGKYFPKIRAGIISQILKKVAKI
ncbi:MAG: isoprenylcysteine carboxylmethyltransferase family protein [Deltaproteobacteria bacterium]|jgi:protein-S-isoprenylcysteine O-methyltransferase Ste14